MAMRMQACLSLLSFKFRKRSRHSYATIGDLPIEVFLQIIDELDGDPVPIACLALTCRSLANILESSLKHPSLRFPVRGYRYGAYDSWYSKQKWTKNQPIPERQRFLRTLERGNDRWAYCSRCVKLHPVAHFSLTHRFLTPSGQRCCRLGKVSTVVDVCPGVVIGYQEKKWLVAAAKEQGMVDIWRDRPGREYKLTIRYNVYVRIRTRVVARVHEGNELSIAVRYQWTDSSLSARRPRKSRPASEVNFWSYIYLCPHRLVMFQQIEAALKTGNYPELVRQGCTDCKTGFRGDREGSTYWVDISMYFGTSTSDLPDKAWLDHASSHYYRYLGCHI
ncbi:hypothetical protein BJY01DRAFT_249850 [Aspergillus pseudoustus]|uniref:F-box domain-containing protein n=1 Tax=Aspergillus pseudoustus TaxID=1810923 RepID=A0ABR4JL70_9EURO